MFRDLSHHTLILLKTKFQRNNIACEGLFSAKHFEKHEFNFMAFGGIYWFQNMFKVSGHREKMRTKASRFS